jgi:hypothetical protein
MGGPMSSAGYSGTPLPKKLGIKDGSEVAFANPPPAWRKILGPLPAGATVKPQARGPLDVIVLFVTARSKLEQQFGPLSKALQPAGGLWVAWPKKASGVDTDLTFSSVQEVGLGAGLVDNKVCAIDETWSGVRFVLRRSERPQPSGRKK